MNHDLPTPRWNRKKIRLPAAVYQQTGAIASITIAVKDRRPVFADPRVASAAVTTLREHAERTGVRVYAYCVMPDHVHLVLEPSERCDLITFVGQFKNLTQRAAWQLGVKGSFWQKSFWDHFARADDVERLITYVLHNPVELGLVDQWRDFPFSGSLVLDLG